MASSTIVPKPEQALEVSHVVAQLEANKEEGPLLTWADGTRIPLPRPLLEVLTIAAHAMQRNQGVTSSYAALHSLP